MATPPCPEKELSTLFISVMHTHGYLMAPLDTCSGPTAHHRKRIPGRGREMQ